MQFTEELQLNWKVCLDSFNDRIINEWLFYDITTAIWFLRTCKGWKVLMNVASFDKTKLNPHSLKEYCIEIGMSY